ncbi:hypothetical protein [Alkalihalobacillus sp. AL-G]|uniref:hypothetical protein n=1 Tax=Alkalihalobacillus sp. AL-G TaxID=2926399 RepID=UPI00272D49FF|nr:hypothetical protein [Alkalihalobacillus sp. AL-G]WLD94810.1 hypothetical protein MOJ78_07995 [Alkalihalobacillus sp. AL-G]
MSKYIVNHDQKVIHRSSYVCDECNIPPYEHQMREDIEEDKLIHQLTDLTYIKCTNCFELILLSQKHDDSDKRI